MSDESTVAYINAWFWLRGAQPLQPLGQESDALPESDERDLGGES